MDALQWWGLFIGILSALVVLWNKVGMNAILTKCWQRTFGKTGFKLDKIITEIEDIRSEVKPNGGFSMRDDITHIYKALDGFCALQGAKINADRQAMFICDAEGKVIQNNRRHQRLTGFSLSELLGDGWINVVHPEEREMVHDKWAEAVADRREFCEQIRYVRPSGREYLVLVEVFRQIGQRGKVIGYLGVVTPLGDDPKDMAH